jgi:hypothetical protein
MQPDVRRLRSLRADGSWRVLGLPWLYPYPPPPEPTHQQPPTTRGHSQPAIKPRRKSTRLNVHMKRLVKPAGVSVPVSWSGVVVFPIGLPGFWASVYCGRLVVVTAGCLARLSCPGPRGAPGGRGQAPWPARTCCTRGRRGSGVKGRPAGRSPQRCAAPLSLEGRPRRLRRTPRARTRRPGVSGRVGGGVPERGRGLRHCQAHIRVSSSQVGCSQDGAPHLRRASGCSKHSRGSFLPRRASRYTTGLGPMPLSLS